MIEPHLSRPVLNETGLDGRYDVNLSVPSGDIADLIAALNRETGLVVTPERRSVVRLVVTPDDSVE